MIFTAKEFVEGIRALNTTDYIEANFLASTSVLVPITHLKFMANEVKVHKVKVKYLLDRILIVD